ncbi:MAG: molybdenum cofactor guanylyltransferase [Propioniciclava sp.]
MIGPFDAVILAGGRGSRMGTMIKPDLTVAGRRLLDIALAASRGARRRVVVGRIAVPPGVILTCENPPYGGPVAGVEAGLAVLEPPADWTLLLAADLPHAEEAVTLLRSAHPADHHDGVCLTEPDGRLQWLLGIYRTDVLRARWADRGDPPATAMYRMLGQLDLLGVPAEPRATADVDTPEDLARAVQEATCD